MDELITEKEYLFDLYFDEILDLYYNLCNEFGVYGFLNDCKFVDLYNVILNNIKVDINSISNILIDPNEEYDSEHSYIDD